MGEFQTVGVPAHRGVAVEDGVTQGLMDPRASLKSCVATAEQKYDTITGLSPDPRKRIYRDTIPVMVEQALSELRKYGVPSETQGWVEWQPNDLKMPIVGRFDYFWKDHGIVADLKTTEKMPQQIKIPHARQVALYSGSDNMRAHLIYVTPKKIAAYKLENAGRHRQALANIARNVENFLALSDDPKFFLKITVPDLDSFYWNNPIMRALAYKYWKV